MSADEQASPSVEDARAFVAEHHRAVLITHRQSGGLQSSPVMVGLDGEDTIVISSRETAYKVRNLREDPRLVLCVFTDAFFGPWHQIEGTAEIIALPEAMDGLVAYYRRLQGEHPDWDDYRRAMQEEQRVLLRVHVEAVGPTKAG
jgi:PPOX class probable F420-dependent enzyme